MLKTFRLAARLLWRDVCAGEWYIVIFTLLLTVSAITALHFYTDRLLRGLDQQSAKFLGGDLVISSPLPISETWLQKAHTLQLRTAEAWSYPSVIRAKNQLQLVNVQAVSAGYPLLDSTISRPPEKTVWIEPRLLSALNIHLHDKITVGAADFTAEKILSHELDSLNTGWVIAPRIVMRLEDVPATRTVLPGSRVEYRLLIAGEKNALAVFRAWITPQLKPGQRLLDVHDQEFALYNILQRAENYLQLALLVCLAISGVAITLSIQQYLRRHTTYAALWRCLGASRQQIVSIFMYQLILIALISGGIGILLGYAAQAFFENLFSSFLQFPLPATGIKPILLGFLTSIFLLFTFSYPVISELPRTSPLFIWRNDIISASPRKNRYLIISAIFMLIFIYWFMDFSLLILFFLDIIIISVGFLYAISLLLLSLFKKILDKTEGTVRRGLSQLVQYPESVSLQFTGFALILITLGVLNNTRLNLLGDWQQSLPEQTPNYFSINIAPSDVANVKYFFHQQHVFVEGMYPITRGRLVALNGKPILDIIPKEAQNNNALHRELNLTWTNQFPSDNKVVEGTMWTPSDAGKPLVSVEKKLADDLQLHLGDQLTFQIGEQTFSAKIMNFRTLNWSSFHPNFFMIFPPGLIDHFPNTYITSFHLTSNQTNFLNQLVKRYPNITIIDVANLLQQIQSLVGKITIAVQYIFLFSLGIGILIFIASLQASMDERRQTYSLLHTLGASKKYIYKSITVEFVCLASMIFLASGFFTEFIAFLLRSYFFNLR